MGVGGRVRQNDCGSKSWLVLLFPGQSCQIRSLPRNFQRPGENIWIQLLLEHQPNLQVSLVLLTFLLLILINDILTLERAGHPYLDVPLWERLPRLVGRGAALGMGPWPASHIRLRLRMCFPL